MRQSHRAAGDFDPKCRKECLRSSSSENRIGAAIPSLQPLERFARNVAAHLAKSRSRYLDRTRTDRLDRLVLPEEQRLDAVESEARFADTD